MPRISYLWAPLLTILISHDMADPLVPIYKPLDPLLFQTCRWVSSWIAYNIILCSLELNLLHGQAFPDTVTFVTETYSIIFIFQDFEKQWEKVTRKEEEITLLHQDYHWIHFLFHCAWFSYTE